MFELKKIGTQKCDYHTSKHDNTPEKKNLNPKNLKRVTYSENSGWLKLSSKQS